MGLNRLAQSTLRPRMWVFAALTNFLVFASVHADQVLDGSRIYNEGILPDGAAVSAIVNNDVPVASRQLHCAGCHKRSVLGSSEGQSVIPGITGELLYNPVVLSTSKPPVAPTQRPAYTKESLARAITNGIGADGQQLDIAMPRYAIEDIHLDSLIAYLGTMNSNPDPGVDETTLVFATIFSDEVAPSARDAYAAVVNGFVQQKNAQTRHEDKRAARGPWHKDWVFKSYRKWQIDEWMLTGPTETWRAQLEQHYAANQVFAIVGGLTESWKPVHEFCQQQKVPCLFPSTDLSYVKDDDFFALYFHSGLTGEIDLIASEVLGDAIDSADGRQAKVTVLFDSRRTSSRVASARLARNLENSFVIQQKIDLSKDPTPQIDVSATYIALLDWEAIESSGLTDVPLKNAYVLGSLLDSAVADLGEVQGGWRLATFAVEPAKLSRNLMRSTGWLRSRRIYDTRYQIEQANAFFALTMTAGAIKDSGMYFRRDYLIERIEHMVDNAVFRSVYPHMSMGPLQRSVVKTARLIDL